MVIFKRFDEQFGLSLFKTKYKSEIYETSLELDFIADHEVQQANRSIDEYILKSTQSSINTTTTPKFSEQFSTTLCSPLFPSTLIPSEFHSAPPFIPSPPHQPIITHSPTTSPSSSSTTTLIPSISTPHLNPSQPTTMTKRYAPPVLPAQLHAMLAYYQSKIPLFDATG